MRHVPERFGIDTNDRLSPERLVGVTFLCRYLSDDGFPRNLTRDEAQMWADRGMDLVTVWENGRTEEVKKGYQSGVRCAKAAREQQRACGGAGQPIYFGVDYITRPSNIDPVLQFFEGVCSVLGRGRTGAYGTRYTIRSLFTEDLIRYGWQTVLFHSKESFYPRAQLRQVENVDKTGNERYGATGYLCYDHAVTFDFGQWRPQFS
jgi:hypothetical protein